MAEINTNYRTNVYQTEQTTNVDQTGDTKDTRVAPPPTGSSRYESGDTPTLDSPRGVNAESYLSASQTVGSDDLGLMLATLMQEFAVKQRQFAKTDRQAQADLAYQTRMDGADKIRESGLVNMIGGFASAAVQAASAGMQLRSAVKGAQVTAEVKNQGMAEFNEIQSRKLETMDSPLTKEQQVKWDAAELEAKQGIMQDASRQATLQTATLDAKAQLVGSMSGAVQGMFGYIASLSDAEKAELDARAGKIDASREESSDQVQYWNDLAAKMQNWIQQVNQSNNESATRAMTAV